MCYSGIDQLNIVEIFHKEQKNKNLCSSYNLAGIVICNDMQKFTFKLIRDCLLIMTWSGWAN